jgi:thioredoxin reductase
MMRATLIRNWSRDLVVLTDGAPGPDEDARARLDALGVPLKEARIARLEGDVVAGGLHRIVFEDGSTIACEALFYGPPQRQRSDLAAVLGCEIEAMGPLPAIVKSDPTTKETTVTGVYVVGDAGTMMQGVVMAAASGAVAASFANHALAAADIAAELAAAPAA